MRLYLDNCTFNRPFDDQSQIRIKLEAEAKLYIQSNIKAGNFELIWSYILDYENEQNPFQERQVSIEKWRQLAVIDIDESKTVLDNAAKLTKLGLKAKDALHVASAIVGQADYFLTTDDKILKKLVIFNKLKVVDPVEFIKLMGANDND